MRLLCSRANSLRAAYAATPIVVPLRSRGYVVDIVYLILLVVLVGLTASYLWLCGRLEERR
ncbi:hypothetical protein GCM10009105_19580 [Dokdonella soli]|uniref:K(+)-transporting ATPase subunit F n=1 Tax=Dokdonella soli TaxID=529810 RepID=A0ABN1IIU5_9GAMM